MRTCQGGLYRHRFNINSAAAGVGHHVKKDAFVVAWPKSEARGTRNPNIKSPQSSKDLGPRGAMTFHLPLPLRRATTRRLQSATATATMAIRLTTHIAGSIPACYRYWLLVFACSLAECFDRVGF